MSAVLIHTWEDIQWVPTIIGFAVLNLQCTWFLPNINTESLLFASKNYLKINKIE